MIDFARKVVYASDCTKCEDCGELVCWQCGDHYSDCPCPGPHSEETHENN